MKDHQIIPEHTCPKCGYKSDCVSMAFSSGARMPVEDDLTMCLNCGQFCFFKKDLQLRLPTQEEKEWIMKQPWADQMQMSRAYIVAGEDLRNRDK
jgi:TPP-dependent indolepyruvate ferredoxin oxidoreductase alpha subunit